MEPTTGDSLRDRIGSAFSGREKQRFDPEDRIPAAVLILIFERDGEPWMVFTRRTQHVSTHKGEISFPGGARDPEDDDLEATGIRETVEELGIDGAVIDIVAELDDYPTFVTNYVVTPFVALIPPQHSYAHSEREIDEVIELPVRELARTLRQEDWNSRGRQYPMYFYETRGYTIWGVTGYILTQFLNIAGDAVGVVSDAASGG